MQVERVDGGYNAVTFWGTPLCEQPGVRGNLGLPSLREQCHSGKLELFAPFASEDAARKQSERVSNSARIFSSRDEDDEKGYGFASAAAAAKKMRERADQQVRMRGERLKDVDVEDVPFALNSMLGKYAGQTALLARNCASHLQRTPLDHTEVVATGSGIPGTGTNEGLTDRFNCCETLGVLLGSILPKIWIFPLGRFFSS
jgi:hypothetical protein